MYAAVGLQFALSIIISAFAGQWLDRRFGTAPWLMLLTLLLGAGGTFYSIYRKLMADLKRDEEARKR
ncbi:MAG: AtpZ/AtpI family protein [Gemmatimonadaceae bacterium]